MTRKLLSPVIFTFMMACSFSSFAQVKIGSNPTVIDPNNNLEIEASTPGRKTSVNKTSGQVTIADGTQGQGRVLTSDPNGNASWQSVQLVKSTINFTNDGVVTIPAMTTLPGNVSITFPENGTYAVSFSFIGDTPGAAKFPVENSWFAVYLTSGGQTVINHQDYIAPGSAFLFMSSMRYVTITDAPVTVPTNYINSSSLPITIRGNSTQNYNDWFAYKVF